MDEYAIVNDSQQDEELLINKYIDQSVSSMDYLNIDTEIESDTIFSELVDPPTGEMSENGNSKTLENKEEKSKR